MTSTPAEPTSTSGRRLDLTGPGRLVPAIVVLLLAGLALRLFIAYLWLPGEGLGSDLRLFRIWAETLATNGPGGFYENAGFADYPPGYLWVLWAMGSLAHLISGITGASSTDVINGLMKLPAIAADLATATLLYWAGARWGTRQIGLLAAGLYLFVPVTWYDSALWGQVDAVGAFLLLAAILLLISGWSEPSVAVAVMAAVTKPQYAIGLVVIGAVLLRRHLLARGTGPRPRPTGWLRRLDERAGGFFTTEQGPLRLVSCAVVGLVVGIVAILPFDLPSQAPAGIAGIPILGSIAGLLSVVGSAAAYYSVLTVNAFNGWALIGPNPLAGAISSPDLRWTSDALTIIGPVSAASLGAALLITVVLLVIATLVIRDDPVAILLGFTVLAIAFFVVPTRVHERYLFPAFGVGALVAAMSPRWLAWYVALAVTNVANLHAVLTLPYPGYGTPGVQGLPLGSFLRDPFVVGIISDLHTLLFIGVIVAFVWQVTVPALRSVLRGSQGGEAGLPATPAVAAAASARAATPLAAPTPVVVAATTTPTRPSTWTARRRLDRRDLGIFVGLVILVLVGRTWRLDMPRTMYFDERWHATTATEFLQDWRYGMPHTLSEVTHPHLAKYLMAAGLVAFGGDHVTGVGLLDTPATDATFEPTYIDPTAPGGRGGDRIVVATGAGIRVAENGALERATTVPIPGAISVSADANAHWLVIGTDSGKVVAITSSDLDGFAASGTAPTVHSIATLDGPVRRVWALGDGRAAAYTDAGRLSIVDVRKGGVIAAHSFPGLSSVLAFGPQDRHLIALAVPEGMVVVDSTSFGQVQLIGVPGGLTGLAFVDGGDQARRERDLIQDPTIYATTTANSLLMYKVGADGALTATDAVPMPGAVSDLKWDRPSNMIHVLGATPDGTPTIYVVEPHGNAVFADAPLEFKPATWILDVQPSDPGTDRQRAIAFAPAGLYAQVDVGSHAFGWRIPGVLLGALTVGLLYLLARILFRRRTVGLLFAGLLAIDGLLFQQSRIAMNDVYVGFFIVAAFTLLAFFLQSSAEGRRARLELLLIPPALGVLFGLGLASKWVALYAIGGAMLIVLLRSWLGRRIALAGMLTLTTVLGALAVADDPANLVFLLLMLGLTALLGVGIVLGEARPAAGDAGPSWLQPATRHGLPFAWVLGSMAVIPILVYVACYIPWFAIANGQSFIDLQVAMYRYHDEFRAPHGAGSPWWAWPLALKPLWGYLETFIDGTQATVLGAGNPFLLWMSVPAMAYGMWQAWRRRSWAIGFVAIVFLALWLPWARVDRVAFNYHYYVALPFALLMLTWFLAELLDRATEPLVRFARPVFGVVLYLPALMWVFKGPLCMVAGVDRANPGSAVCAAPFTDVLGPVLIWTVVATVIFVFGVLRASPRRMVEVMLGVSVVTSVALYPALAAMVIPNGWPWVYQGVLPTWDSTFQFWSDTSPAVSHPVLGIGTIAVLLVAVGVTAGAIYAARRWGSGLSSEDDDPDMSEDPDEPTPPTSPGPHNDRPRGRPVTDVAPPAIAMAVAADVPARESGPIPAASIGGAAVAVAATSPSASSGLRTPALALPSVTGATATATATALSTRATIVALVVLSLVAALVVDRFAGFGGPWLWNFDMALANYPFAAYFHEAVTKGTLPFWQDRVGMGFPLYAEGQIGALYPLNWLIYQLPPLVALDVSRLLHLTLAGVGGGLIVLRMTGSRTGAATAALVVVLCGGIASKLEWTQVVTVYGWMPWVLLPLLWRRPRPTRGLIVLAGVFWGVQALGGHPPYWVLTGIAAVTLIVVQAPHLRTAVLPTLGRVVLFGLVGVGVGAVQLVPTLVITTLSWRAQGVGSAALFEYSATPFDLLAVAFGNAFLPAQGSAWDISDSWYPGGSVWATLEVYAFVGLPALALAAMAFVTRRGRPVAILAAVMVAIPLIGVLQPAVWEAIPGLNGLRHPIRAYLVLDLALAIGAGIGVARLGRGASWRPAAVVVGVALGLYAVVTVIAVALPGVFDQLVRLWWPYVPAGQEGTIRDLAVAALTRPWPFVFEVALGLAILWVIRRPVVVPALRVATVALVALPLALLTPAVNQSLPSSAFTLEGTSLANTVRSLAPGQVLTLREPFYSGFPAILAGVGTRDPHVYTSQFGLSLRLQSSEDIIAALRAAGPASPLARAVGVDTVVGFGGACGAREVARDAATGVTVCRVDDALRPPYWMPAAAVLASSGGGTLPTTPVDAIVDPERAVAGASPATIVGWDENAAAIILDAPADGYVFIDRSWWPGWQVTVDGVGVAPQRAWGGQLVPVTAGAHTIEERLVPWDARLGALISVASLAIIGVWAWRRRARRTDGSQVGDGQPARSTA